MNTKIIVADDSQTIQKVISITLANENYEVFECVDATEINSFIVSEDPALILLDFNLSNDKTGYDLAREIKLAKNNIKIMMLFGTFDTIDEALLSEAGVNSHIIKPFDGNKFINTCRQLIEDSELDIEEEVLMPEIIVESRPSELEMVMEDWGIEVPNVIGSSDETPEFPPVIEEIELSKEEMSSLAIDDDNNSLPSNTDLEYPDAASVDTSVSFEDELEAKVSEETDSDDLWAADEFVMQNTAPIESAFIEEEIEPLQPHTLEKVVDNTEVSIEVPSDFPLDVMDEIIEPYEPQADPFDHVDFDQKVQDAVDKLMANKFEKIIEKVAWEIIPDLAENLIRKELDKIKEEFLNTEM